jgi:hypothetical protein
MKQCFKCKRHLELFEFYKHSMMADGHLNKCKFCTKQDTENNRKNKEQDINWVLSERKRHREKSRKYRSDNKDVNDSNLYNKKWCKKNPEKRKAHNAVKNALKSGKIHRHPCCICGNKAQAHHEDYSKPLDVIWLCLRHHADRHIEINEQKLKETF